MSRNLQQKEVENSGQNTAVLPTDYAFAVTHGQPAPPPDPCQNVIQSDSTGENIVVCGLNCWLTCSVCEMDACSISCLRDMGCTHEPHAIPAVAA